MRRSANGLIDCLWLRRPGRRRNEDPAEANRADQAIRPRHIARRPDPLGGASRRIALVVGEGEITRGSGNSSTDDQGITAAAFTKLLKQVEDDSSIRGVIIRVDSPGGDGVASDDILHEAKNLSKKKPVVISMSDLAASGGYFISMTGDPIVAYPNTLTGSIGVIFARISLHGLYDKIGVNKQMLKRGQYADLDSDYAPLNDEQRQKISGQIDAFYKGFVSRVAEGRKKTFDQIEPLAQGRVWLGAQAKQNGLVDELGGLDRAVELVRQRAHIAASDRITLVPYPGKRSVLDVLFGRPDEAEAIETKLEQVLGKLPDERAGQRRIHESDAVFDQREIVSVRYVFLNNGISSNAAITAHTTEPSHARLVMARLVVCSASQICHASGRRALMANASRIPRKENRRIVFTTPAERLRASTALRVPTAAVAARLHKSTPAKSWAGGAMIDPCQ